MKSAENSRLKEQVWRFSTGALIVFGLYLTSHYNYLLFHTIAELVSVAVAFGLFMIAWNSSRVHTNQYLLFLGIAYLFISILDLVHTLSYEGMGVFFGNGSDLATRMWIGGRYMESLTLLAAPMFFTRRVNLRKVFTVYTAITTLFFLTVFYWDIFPVCFIEGQGLTSFKINSEYIICFILLAAGTFVVKHKERFDRPVFHWVIASIGLTVASELAFTFYVSVYGLSNLIGHFFKLFSFYFIYKALIETSLTKPYSVLFRELKENEERYYSLFSHMIDGFAYHKMVYDDNGRPIDYVFLEVNDAFETITGLDAENLIGEKITRVIPGIETDEAGWIGIFGKVAKEGEDVRFENFSRTLNRWYRVSAFSTEKDYFVAVFEDITEKKRMENEIRKAKDELENRVIQRTAELNEANLELEKSEKQLRHLSFKLLTAEEEERKRVAGEIHDSIGSSLAAIKYGLEGAGNLLAAETQAAKMIDTSIQMTQEAIEEARRLMNDLRPPLLDARGVVPTIEWYCRRFQSIYPDIEIETDLSADDSKIPEKLKIVIFRVIQEAFNNLAKYSGADRAAIRLTGNAGHLNLVIEDNGKGFDTEEKFSLAASGRGGLGITGMKERVDQTRGAFDIESSVNKGTTIRASWILGNDTERLSALTAVSSPQT